MKYFLRCVAVFFFSFSISAQSVAQTTQAAKVRKLNEYVSFSNESIHGLLIVLRMLEGFNRNINKYVDLPNQQINFYGNKDLPQDIFQDENHEFYTTSPNEWFAKINTQSTALSSSDLAKLNAIAKDLKGVNLQINRIRFDIETLINSINLTKRENQSLVYDKLEEGVALIRNFYKYQQALEALVVSLAPKDNYTKAGPKTASLLKALDNVYADAHAILKKMYNKDGEDLAVLLKSHQASVEVLKQQNIKLVEVSKVANSVRAVTYITNILNKSMDAIKDENAFVQSESVPAEYKMYDKYYYYYNLATLNKFNKAGPGIVFDINQIRELVSDTLLMKFEIPHYFKVIYPEKLEKTDMLKASDPKITAAPIEVKGRSVVAVNRVIKVDSAIVNFKLFDHKIIDKDVVSLQFNGDWIIEKFEISAKPKEFVLQLNKTGKNYLLLHADEMGRQPPATIALSYVYKGKKETIILNSDIQKSEMIEIIIE